jgi:hypothetical protein
MCHVLCLWCKKNALLTRLTGVVQHVYMCTKIQHTMALSLGPRPQTQLPATTTPTTTTSTSTRVLVLLVVVLVVVGRYLNTPHNTLVSRLSLIVIVIVIVMVLLVLVFSISISVICNMTRNIKQLWAGTHVRIDGGTGP